MPQGDHFDMARDAARALVRYARMLAMHGHGLIVEEAPVDHGRLRGSFQLQVVGPLVWRIVSGVDYLVPVHEGTGPYMIFPVEKQALRFEIDGEVIFAKSVEHPGLEGNPFIERALQQLEEDADGLLESALQEEGLK